MNSKYKIIENNQSVINKIKHFIDNDQINE